MKSVINGSCPYCSKQAIYNGTSVVGIERPKNSTQFIAIHRSCFTPFALKCWAENRGV